MNKGETHMTNNLDGAKSSVIPTLRSVSVTTPTTTPSPSIPTSRKLLLVRLTWSPVWLVVLSWWHLHWCSVPDMFSLGFLVTITLCTIWPRVTTKVTPLSDSNIMSRFYTWFNEETEFRSQWLRRYGSHYKFIGVYPEELANSSQDWPVIVMLTSVESWTSMTLMTKIIVGEAYHRLLNVTYPGDLDAEKNFRGFVKNTGLPGTESSGCEPM